MGSSSFSTTHDLTSRPRPNSIDFEIESASVSAATTTANNCCQIPSNIANGHIGQSMARTPRIVSTAKTVESTPVNVTPQISHLFQEDINPRTKQPTILVASTAKTVELAPVTAAAYSSALPQQLSSLDSTQHDNSYARHISNGLRNRSQAEQDLRKQLRDTCSYNVNNDCAWTKPDTCRSQSCTRPHICKTWWLGAKNGNLYGCPHG